MKFYVHMMAFFFLVSITSLQGHYMVPNVQVDVSAPSTHEAKRQAHEQGEITAFQTLLQRMVSDKDQPRLPSLTNQEIRDFIINFSVQQEKSAPGRYMATLQYVFNETAIQQFLKTNQIEFSDRLVHPILLIPTIKGDHLPPSMVDQWRRLVNMHILETKALPLKMGPLYQDENGSLRALQSLSQQYGTQDIIILTLTMESIPGVDQADHYTLSLSLQEDALRQVNYKIQLPMVESTLDALPLSLSALTTQALEIIVKNQLAEKKQDHQQLTQKIELHLKFKTMEEWLKKYEQLILLTGGNIRIQSLSKTAASILIETSNPQGLINDLATHGFPVEISGPLHEIIKEDELHVPS